MKRATAIVSIIGLVLLAGTPLLGAQEDPGPEICSQYASYPGCTNGGDGDGDNGDGDGDNGDGDGDNGDGDGDNGDGDGDKPEECDQDAYAAGYALGYADGFAGKDPNYPDPSECGADFDTKIAAGYLEGYKKGVAAAQSSGGGDGNGGGSGGIFTGGGDGGFGGGYEKKPGPGPSSGGHSGGSTDQGNNTSSGGGLAMTGSGTASVVSFALGLIALGATAVIATRRSVV